jgi:hypothetical protein
MRGTAQSQKPKRSNRAPAQKPVQQTAQTPARQPLYSPGAHPADDRSGSRSGDDGGMCDPRVQRRKLAERVRSRRRIRWARDQGRQPSAYVTAELHSAIPVCHRVGSKGRLHTTAFRPSARVANPTPGKTNLRVKCQTPRVSGFARALTAQHPATRSDRSTALGGGALFY